MYEKCMSLEDAINLKVGDYVTVIPREDAEFSCDAQNESGIIRFYSPDTGLLFNEEMMGMEGKSYQIVYIYSDDNVIERYNSPKFILKDCLYIWTRFFFAKTEPPTISEDEFASLFGGGLT